MTNGGGTFITGISNNVATNDTLVTVNGNNQLKCRTIADAVGSIAYTKSEVDAKVGYSKTEADGLFRTIATSYSKTDADSTFRTIATSYSKTEGDGRYRLVVDSYTKAQIDTSLGLKADKSTTYTKTEGDARYRQVVDSYTKSQTDSTFRTIATSYSKTDVDNTVATLRTIASSYSKAEVDSLIGGVPTVNAYTKLETDNLLVMKSNVGDSFTKVETSALLALLASTSYVNDTFRKKVDQVPYNEISHGNINTTVRFGGSAGVALSTAVGGNAGIQNTCIGNGALGRADGNCYSNVAIGYRAGYGVLSGNSFQNVFIGRNAGNNGEAGNYNICIGSSANAQTHASCIAIGYNTTATAEGQIKITTSVPAGGTYVSGIRQYDSSAEDIVATIGADNRLGGRSLTTAVGALAYTKAEIGDLFYTKVSIDSNFFTKDYVRNMIDAFYFASIYNNSLSVGSQTSDGGRRLRLNTQSTNLYNISVGEIFFIGNTTTNTTVNNVVVGNRNLRGGSSINYSDNIILGKRAFYHYAGTNLNRNILIGHDIAWSITSESYAAEDNFIVGANALEQSSLKNLRVKNNILLMPGVATITANLDNEIWLGNSSHTRLRCHGTMASVGSPASALYVNTTTGYIGIVSSSRRCKHDIVEVDDVTIDAYDKMQPVSYKYNNGDGSINFGYIAEDVIEPLQIMKDGQIETVAFNHLHALQHASHKRLQKRVTELEQTVANLTDMVSKLLAMNNVV